MLCAHAQNISVQIENPFAVLPLAAFCATHKANLRHMTGCRAEALQLLTGGVPLGKPPSARVSMSRGPSTDRRRSLQADLAREALGDGAKSRRSSLSLSLRQASMKRLELPDSAFDNEHDEESEVWPQQGDGRESMDTVIEVPSLNGISRGEGK